MSEFCFGYDSRAQDVSRCVCPCHPVQSCLQFSIFIFKNHFKANLALTSLLFLSSLRICLHLNVTSRHLSLKYFVLLNPNQAM